MKKCAIFGASGHGKVIGEIAELNFFQCYFFDDKLSENVEIEGNKNDLINDIGSFDNVIVAIGDNETRKKIYAEFEAKSAKMNALVHPNSVIGKNVELGAGTVVMAGVVINPGCRIGKSSIINTKSIIDHDCLLGDFVHISPGTMLAGNVTVGSDSWLGLGSKIINNIAIGEKVIIGAGSTVTKNVIDHDKVVGTPAKSIK